MDSYLNVPDLAATAMHIVTLQGKLDRLHEVRDQAWAQMLTAAARAYKSRQIDDADLGVLLGEMKQSYGAGFTALWNSHMPWTHAQVPHRAGRAALMAPNGPMGTWIGEWPPSGSVPHPMDRIPVVYVFYDDLNEPVYVGSTGRFLKRMEDHRRTPKMRCVRRWTAYRCADREAAYELEVRLLHEHKPRLNTRRAR